MSPVAAPADKRFRRSHVKPSSRRRSRLRHAWIVVRTLTALAVVAYGSWRGVALVAGARVLQVGQISVGGNVRLSTGEVLALLDGLQGQHILGLDLARWQGRLLASPWVEDATLRRVLPGTVDVRIRERRPVAIGRMGKGLYLVDANGVVVDEYGPAYADFDLPIVDGLAGPRGTPAAVDPARARLAARVIAGLADQPRLARLLSQIDVSNPHDAVVMLQGDTTQLRLGEEEFAGRLQQYLDLGDALRERVAQIDYVDLRFPERLYVRPAKATQAPASARTRR